MKVETIITRFRLRIFVRAQNNYASARDQISVFISVKKTFQTIEEISRFGGIRGNRVGGSEGNTRNSKRGLERRDAKSSSVSLFRRKKPRCSARNLGLEIENRIEKSKEERNKSIFCRVVGGWMIFRVSSKCLFHLRFPRSLLFLLSISFDQRSIETNSRYISNGGTKERRVRNIELEKEFVEFEAGRETRFFWIGGDERIFRWQEQ